MYIHYQCYKPQFHLGSLLPPFQKKRKRKKKMKFNSAQWNYCGLEQTQLWIFRSNESSNLKYLFQEQIGTMWHMGKIFSTPDYTSHMMVPFHLGLLRASRPSFEVSLKSTNICNLLHIFSLDLKGYSLSHKAQCLNELEPHSRCNWKKWTFTTYKVYSHCAG